MIRLAGTVARLPRYLKLAKGLAGEPTLPAQHKAAVGLGLGYAVLPFDLIPGIIPVLGQLDDMAAVLLGIRHALRACPPDVGAAHLARAGLKPSAIDDDLRTVAVASVWLVSKAAELGGRAVSGTAALVGTAFERTGLAAGSSVDEDAWSGNGDTAMASAASGGEARRLAGSGTNGDSPAGDAADGAALTGHNADGGAAPDNAVCGAAATKRADDEVPARGRGRRAAGAAGRALARLQKRATGRHAPAE
jgi:uncharacterized membrane protein YkvA (DUF1232 family)